MPTELRSVPGGWQVTPNPNLTAPFFRKTPSDGHVGNLDVENVDFDNTKAQSYPSQVCVDHAGLCDARLYNARLCNAIDRRVLPGADAHQNHRRE
jgi:hypothetical protein